MNIRSHHAGVTNTILIAIVLTATAVFYERAAAIAMSSGAGNSLTREDNNIEIGRIGVAVELPRKANLPGAPKNGEGGSPDSLDTFLTPTVILSAPATLS